VTGEEVGFAGRVASAIFAIPGLGNVLKLLSKGGRLLAKAVVVLVKALDRVVQRLPGLLRRLWTRTLPELFRYQPWLTAAEVLTLHSSCRAAR
jgi:hypothetical protein